MSETNDPVAVVATLLCKMQDGCGAKLQCLAHASCMDSTMNGQARMLIGALEMSGFRIIHPNVLAEESIQASIRALDTSGVVAYGLTLKVQHHAKHMVRLQAAIRAAKRYST